MEQLVLVAHQVHLVPKDYTGSQAIMNMDSLDPGVKKVNQDGVTFLLRRVRKVNLDLLDPQLHQEAVEPKETRELWDSLVHQATKGLKV